MNVPVRIFANEKLLSKMKTDRTMSQGLNASKLPGIQKYAMILPDGHEGYGFPIGGAAAIEIDGGVISPGAIGFDINCGVRLLRTNLVYDDVKDKIHDIIDHFYNKVPSGVGRHGFINVNFGDLETILESGVEWAISKDYAWPEDAEHTEENGSMAGANADKISDRAKQRGRKQIGTLGSGNHFLEIQVVDEIFDEETAKVFGISEKNQIVVMIHTGSRGLGHQVCSDYLQIVERVRTKYGITNVPRELACAPLSSREGEDYFAAMAAAANFAWTNRQAIMYWVRHSLSKILKSDPEDLGLHLLYDVAHNIGKKEIHTVDGVSKNILMHRKGATRAFPAGHKEVPSDYRNVGQPVLIPGSMGTSSYVLAGGKNSMELTFGTTAHGAGRMMSRGKAIRTYNPHEVQQEMRKKGIYVRADKLKTLSEENDGAYKNVDDVVEVSHQLGIGTKVVKLKPLGVTKG
ncbi:MAG: RtcB family protein [Candidatus Ranarchaeia archaeon]